MSNTKQQDVALGVLVTVLISIVLLVIFLVGKASGEFHIKNDCVNYGKFINGDTYICNKVDPLNVTN